jgi:hypothetical protein
MKQWAEWMTIKTFNMSHEAYPIMSYLQSEGIECFLKPRLRIRVCRESAKNNKIKRSRKILH